MATRKQELAAILMSMTHRELKEVGYEFSAMIDEEARPKITTEAEFVELLFDWAEATDVGVE
jgi:hypothetical protein